MLAVLDTHPSVTEHLATGEFVVQQQSQNSFIQTSVDQTIEQTMNIDSKTWDGQIGFSNNVNVAHHWIFSFNQRAEIPRSCTEMAGKAEDSHKKKDLSKSRYEVDIQNVMHTIESLQNPFAYNEKELMNVASGK